MRTKSKLFLGMVLCGILLLGISTGLPEAQAQVPPVLTGTFNVTLLYSPGITLANRNQVITGAGNLGNLGATIPLGTIVSATYTVSGTALMSCLSVNASATAEIFWRDANNMVVDQSTAKFTVSTGTATFPVMMGVITDGLFETARILPVFGTAVPNGLCGLLFGPTTAINFTGQVEGQE